VLYVGLTTRHTNVSRCIAGRPNCGRTLRLRPNLTSTARSYSLEDAGRRRRADQHDERRDGEEVDDDHLACFASAERTGCAAGGVERGDRNDAGDDRGAEEGTVQSGPCR
jgi:hypothetical protein